MEVSWSEGGDGDGVEVGRGSTPVQVCQQKLAGSNSNRCAR